MRKALLFILIVMVICLTQIKVSLGADTITVSLSPGTANVSNSFNITFVVQSSNILGNTPIELLFDSDSQSTKISLPSALSPSNFTLQVGSTTYPVSSATFSNYGSSKTIVLNTPSNLIIPSGTTFTITISNSANIIPLTTGSHSLIVWVGVNRSITLVSNFNVVSSGPVGGSITLSSVLVGNPKLGATSTYRFNFVTGSNLVQNDTISIEFPSGFTVPQSISGNNFSLLKGSYTAVLDFSSNVSVSGNVITLRLPQTAYSIYANDSCTVICGEFTGIINPTVPGQYTFKMWTSKQPTPATYTVTLGTSVTNLSWSVSPLTAGAIGEHTISFKTSSTGALSTNDTVSIVFPNGFNIPSTITSGSVLVNNTTAQATASSNVLTIKVPTSIANSTQVNIKILSSANIVNPPANQSGYKIKVYTSQDQLQVESNAVIFTPSTIQNLKVTVNPQVVNKSATLTFEFTTGLGGALSSGDNISIVFPSQFTLPSQIQTSLFTIAVGNSNLTPSSVNKSGNTIILTLPQGASIASNSNVKITISNQANITTPQNGGTYKFSLYTSKETTQVDVNVDIFAYPKSSIVVTPQNPDGLNGYYITQPNVTFSVYDIVGVTATLYYKINDATYQQYDLVNKPKISIPEGKSTVYFYAVDNFGNKEPENSRSFLVDLTDPVVNVQSPAENSVVVQPTFTLKGTVKSVDLTNTSLTVQGKAVSVNSDGSFEALITLQNEGVNTIPIIARSPSGRTLTKQFSVNYIARVTIFLQVGNDKAYINGEPITIDASPFIQNGNVMVPLRFVLTSFKANLEWDGIFQIITLSLGSNRMRLQIGNLRADVNGALKMLPTPPVLVKNVTFVPLRFISENFGAQVTWDPTLKAVSIIYPKP
ncbi:MAG: stalk domain-containing protein [Nitrososphaeria archaeon]